MSPRNICFVLLAGLLAVGCSSDGPSGPGGTARSGPDFDTFPPGTLVATTEAGYIVSPDTTDILKVAPEVVDLGGGDMALRDPDNTDSRGASFRVKPEGQRLFRYAGLDGADLRGTTLINPSSEIRVMGFRLDEMVGTEHYGPTTREPANFPADALSGQSLSHLVIDVISLGGDASDDLCVSFIELNETNTALVDFDPLPPGSFEHLFAGEFELTWDRDESQQRVVELDDGQRVLTDPARDDQVGAAVMITRRSGGSFALDTMYAMDREGPGPLETNIDSRVLLEGFREGALVATDTYKPTDNDILPFVADMLAGEEIDTLRLSVLSVCGVYKCDDFGVAGFVFTIVD